MKTKTIFYKVYTRKGEYHHAYSAKLQGSREWAIDCARVVDGYVTQVSDDLEKTEEKIYTHGVKA
tara:strand:+ start:302 stop:496 length:195 start_codon:yes stop_codon:yes gene_type:complete